jgi:hypothetical protein
VQDCRPCGCEKGRRPRWERRRGSGSVDWRVEIGVGERDRVRCSWDREDVEKEEEEQIQERGEWLC